MSLKNKTSETEMAAGESALELRGLSKRFKKRRGVWVQALDDISLTIGEGEVVGILGPNGSGKSTLVRVVSTLVTPDAGSVRVFGVDALRKPKVVQRSMNRVSVEASFFKKLSALENLSYGAKLYGVTERESKVYIREILAHVGFDYQRAQEPMEHLSRGMQQKIALARALLTSPMLMLLDEPTTGLDPRSKRDVQAFIRQIQERHGSSILLCTHDMDEAEELCDRVGIMMDGRILALDEPKKLRKRYATDGRVPDLEEAFMTATGYTVEEASVGEEGE